MSVVATSAAPVAAPVAPAEGFSTPATLRLLQWVTLGVTLVFLIVALSGVRATRSRVNTIGNDTVPSIIAAQHLKVSVADLDANVANELIAPVGQSATSVKGYDTDRKEITASLIKAAGNITYGESERIPLTDLTNALAGYEQKATRARLLHTRGDEPRAIAAYREARTQLQGEVYPAADALTKANQDALTREDRTLSTEGGVATGFVALIGVGLLLVLVAGQIYLARRTNRVLNPGLLAATVVAAFTVVALLRAFAVAGEQVRVARDDAFISLSALWKARAVAYDANGDESVWLYDPTRRAALEKGFESKAALLLKQSDARPALAEMSALATTGSIPPGATGFLPTEINNITFAGEKEAALDANRAWGAYLVSDAKLRDLENTGSHTEAVRFCVGMAPGQSNYAFDQFDKALDKVITINHSAFRAAVGRGFAAVNGYEVGLPLAALAIIGCTFAGLRPRIREYEG